MNWLVYDVEKPDEVVFYVDGVEHPPAVGTFLLKNGRIGRVERVSYNLREDDPVLGVFRCPSIRVHVREVK